MRIGQLALTRLPVDDFVSTRLGAKMKLPPPRLQDAEPIKLRVRLDLINLEGNMLNSTVTECIDIPCKLDEPSRLHQPVGDIAWNICALLVQDKGMEIVKKVCSEIATFKVTGLIGLPTRMPKRLYSSYETRLMDPSQSQFITFELDLSGSPGQALDINWLNVRYPEFLKILGIRTISVLDEFMDVMFPS